MPLLTFVLVVHDEQAYVRECAASVLEHGGADCELVVIDDASVGHVPELLDELTGEPRVRVERLGERVGRGEARDRGLELAGGEYVWFVEVADVLVPSAVAERLGEIAPDVLVVHHTDESVLGTGRPGTHRRLLARVAERGPGTLDERPGLADAAPEIWNKVLRTAFVRELGVGFAAGEIAVTWAALLAAGRIAASPDAAYVRGRRAAQAPLDVFAAYDAVFAFLDAHPELPLERRKLVAPAMLRHQLELLPRVPERDRREFFHRMALAWRARGDGALSGARARLVERDAYRAFRALEASGRMRRALHRRRAALTARTRTVALQRHYRARLGQPIDPRLAVFAAYWYRGYACNPRAIYETARELVPEMRGVWVVRPDAVDRMPAGVEHVVAGTREYYDVLARAAYLVNNVNFPNDVVKRPGSVHLQTHHGTPLKRMGLDLREHPVTSGKMDFARLLRRVQRWDYSVSQNAFSTVIWERVYPGRYESLETGYPRNDALANATEEDVRRIRAELGLEPGQVAVLFAPTHREYERGYTPVADLAAVAEALGPDHVVLARVHYLYQARERRVRDVSDHPSIEELCLAADVLVTDYSSIMFDYAVLDRPIVAHVPDWDVYRTVRGTYFDVTAEPPGVVTRSHAELVDAFRSGAVRGEVAREARAAFRARFCALEDGRAAERVVRRVWLGEREAAVPTGAAPVAR